MEIPGSTHSKTEKLPSFIRMRIGNDWLRDWNAAAEMDGTIRAQQKHIPQLKRKFVPGLPYSRSLMFTEMARRNVAIFKNIPVLVNAKSKAVELLVAAIESKFHPRQTARVQLGRARKQTQLPVREVMRRWSASRAIFGVTDLHVRGTRLEEIIDTRALSDFNLLICGSEDLALQEMMTLVIASPGNVTDSHSDDPDGTNHCFTGKKLWLVWDCFEGMANGLQDMERQPVQGQASFDLTTFLQLKSSRWFFVTQGDTLFLPGNLTHKVITLEPYLGIGSFHVGLPSCLDSLTRWIYYGPLWSIDDSKGECSDACGGSRSNLLENNTAVSCRLKTTSSPLGLRLLTNGFSLLAKKHQCGYPASCAKALAIESANC